MKRGFAVGIVCALLMLGVARADADNHLTDRAGIGGETTLAGGDFIQGRKWFGPKLNVGVLLGLERHSASMGDVDVSLTTIQLGGQVIFVLASGGNTHFGVFGGLGLDRVSQSAGDADNSSTDFIVEGGLHVEHLFTNHFALHAKLGLVILLLGESSEDAGDGATVINFFGGNDVVGSAGFTFYFGQ